MQRNLFTRVSLVCKHLLHFTHLLEQKQLKEEEEEEEQVVEEEVQKMEKE